MAMHFEDILLGCFVTLSQVHNGKRTLGNEHNGKRTLNIKSLCDSKTILRRYDYQAGSKSESSMAH